jgi:hypothetical protein
MTPCEPPLDQIGRLGRLPQMKPRADDGRPQGRQFLLEGGPDRAGEPLGGLHHDVHHERAATQLQL